MDLKSRLRGESRFGFTLIELLIVISVIVFLMSILLVAVMGQVEREKVNKTKRAIQVVERGLERLSEYYRQGNKPFPDKDEMGTIGDLNVREMTDGEWLRLLLLPTEEEIDKYLRDNLGITKAALSDREAEDYLNQTRVTLEGGRDVERGMAFVDGWDQTLYYRYPGEDHSDEVNVREPPDAGQNNAQRDRPDIWSAGQDGKNAYTDDDRDRWADQINDPQGTDRENASHVDDVTNWFPLDT
jgi:prepilin-type N-terminal cleavage/methylation domain-containing protein